MWHDASNYNTVYILTFCVDVVVFYTTTFLFFRNKTVPLWFFSMHGLAAIVSAWFMIHFISLFSLKCRTIFEFAVTPALRLSNLQRQVQCLLLLYTMHLHLLQLLHVIQISIHVFIKSLSIVHVDLSIGCCRLVVVLYVCKSVVCFLVLQISVSESV